jgi:2-keto-4-pentenoate hydratase/2-oxohepta-3-ene-1,7-dioic acid hydratase in catechol pathway
MTSFSLATIDDGRGAAAAVVVGDDVRVLAGRPSVAHLLEDWNGVDRLAENVGRGRVEEPVDLGSVRMLPPVPRAPNLYMVGANYADHSREMQGLGPDDPIAKPEEGPFIFLKPTTTLVGHREQVVLPAGYRSVDWELELAVVIGRRAHRVGEAEALRHVAGYTVANDISVRDAFKRTAASEIVFQFDWFGQKAWHTSCPMGPAIVPTEFCPDPMSLGLRLTVNDEVKQESNTSEMIFSVAEIVSYISRIVPLVPGDLICTGTCAGVGMGRGQFLAAGDVVVAEIEGIGVLSNTTVADVDAAVPQPALQS